MFDPIQGKADESVLIEIRNKGFVFFANGHSFGLFIHHVEKQRIDQFIEIEFELVQRNRMINVHDEGLVLLHQIENRKETLLPRGIGFAVLEGFVGIFKASPLDEVGHILEMIIKSLAINPAVFHDVRHGNLVERLIGQKLFQRLGQGSFGDLIHLDLPKQKLDTCIILSLFALCHFFSCYTFAMDSIAVAMEKEAAYLLSKSQIKETKQAGFAKIMLCSLKGKDYILVVTGIGKAFASSAIEALTLLYPSLTSCLNIGVAGSLDVKALPLFSSIVASSLIEHDLDTSAIGDPKGLVSGINLVSLPVDESLSSRVIAAAKKVGENPRRGIISSGDTFYADEANKKRIHRDFGSLASDMEAAPMAQIAYVNHLPFASLRTISDAENNGEEYAKNADKAATIAGKIAEAFLLQ